MEAASAALGAALAVEAEPSPLAVHESAVRGSRTTEGPGLDPGLPPCPGRFDDSDLGSARAAGSA